ncbi:MAG: hypothetical protein ACJ8FS_02555 [Sphingomicrobium sp.]
MSSTDMPLVASAWANRVRFEASRLVPGFWIAAVARAWDPADRSSWDAAASAA